MEYISHLLTWQSGLIAVASVAVGLILYHQKSTLGINPKENIVVITGCDSGFGLMLANRLTKLGYLVVAGCLTQEGVERLEDVVSLPIVCDVTKIDDIARLPKAVEKHAEEKRARLWALVNNAGIAPCGHIDWLSRGAHRRTFDVNYFGTVDTIQSLLYLLKRTKNSRIINISSIAGISGFPNGGAYCGSKHAVEGMAKCLRQELLPWNIYVANVNPGFMKTPILVSSREVATREFNNADKAITAHYDLATLDKLNDVIERLQEDPTLVVDEIVNNLTYAKPSLFNGVGVQAKIVRAMQLLPHRVALCVENVQNHLLQIGPRASALKEVQVN